MSDVGDNNFIRYIYRGAEGERIPLEATHIFVHKDVSFVRARAFRNHRNIIEVICHVNVEMIEEEAFRNCPRLRRVIMPGVKIVEKMVFSWSTSLTDVDCSNLEIIQELAFAACRSLRSISLPSARIVESSAISNCHALVDAKFGRNLETIERGTFYGCTSLERITIPLKNGVISANADNVFTLCEKLEHVDLVEAEVLQKTVAALQLEEWRNDMNEVIDSINRILPDARAGHYSDYDDDNYREVYTGKKARVIRRWIRSVLRKVVRYKAKHQHVLDGAATRLQLALPQDIVINSVLPFLRLPSYSFDGEEEYSAEGRIMKMKKAAELESNCCSCCIQ